MQEEYRPNSDFLMMVLHDEVPLTGGSLAEVNLARLIDLTSDDDDSNRDWAVTLLAASGIDTAEVRSALRRAADDPQIDTRCEALLRLAVVEPGFALPRVKEMLEQDDIYALTLEAAGLLADRSLIAVLEQICVRPFDDVDVVFAVLARDALEASRTGKVPRALEWRLV
ncbi:lyase [Sphingomonas sp. ST-64]|uniref:Lyase n=1 Tax=Sphingomonas plantiphila TaxID=3163295 RepID=A0ABW8YJ87_9SPHN